MNGSEDEDLEQSLAVSLEGGDVDWKAKQLADIGYQIVSLSGDYCCAIRGDREVMLKWDGESWIVL